jgi:hypothetical protein
MLHSVTSEHHVSDVNGVVCEQRFRLAYRHFIMPARRRSYSSRRRYGPRRSPRYVQDAIASRIQVTAETARFKIITGATINGIRRVARIDLALATPSAAAQFVFALVYVPEGINGGEQQLLLATTEAQTSLYVPEQHVLTSGTVTAGTVQRYFVPTGRSLASNDTIWLYARAHDADCTGVLDFRVSFIVAFA